MKRNAILIFITACLVTACIGPHVSRPVSDVPIITDIGWWSKEGIRLDNLEVQILEAPLNLFNNEALVRYHLKGTLQTKGDGWRPYVKKTHVSERFAKDGNGNRIGDIEITPVIGYEQDKEYKGSAIPFDYRIEKLVQTFQWGMNKYHVHSLDLQRFMELQQKK